MLILASSEKVFLFFCALVVLLFVHFLCFARARGDRAARAETAITTGIALLIVGLLIVIANGGSIGTHSTVEWRTEDFYSPD